MAKRISDTAKYFPHYSDASSGDTLTALQTAFKNDGYAFWFRLLERLAAADGHYLDMRNDTKWRTLAAKSFIDVETADKIMEILLANEAVDLELWTEYKIIWCRNLVDNLADVYRNRRRELPQKPIVKDGIITCNYGVTTCSLHVNTSELHVNHMSNKTKLKEIKLNKNSSSSSIPPPSLEKVLDLYETNIGELTDQLKLIITDNYDEYGGDWITEAISEAVRQNKRTWAYIEGILQNWLQYGYKDPTSRCTTLKHR